MLRSALKARDSDAARVLRGVMAALDNAGALPEEEVATHLAASVTEVPRQRLSGMQVAEILQAEIDVRREAAETFRLVGRAEEAGRLHSEIATIEGLLQLLDPTS